jgi:hypothetical protein
VGERGFSTVRDFDLMICRAGRVCTFLLRGAARNEGRFEKERDGAIRQRQWAAKHPLAPREDGVAGERD